jgi:hypothetical protein
MEAAGTVRRPGRARAPILARIEKGALSHGGHVARAATRGGFGLQEKARWAWRLELLCSAFPMSGVDTKHVADIC